MKKIGLTGGIGSGKTTVAKIFECLRVPVFYSDVVGRNALNAPEIIQFIYTEFGDSYILSSGLPDRKKIADLVFKNPDKLAQLNDVIHPWVKNQYKQWLESQSAPYTVNEAAILFETGSYQSFDANILVTAPDEERIRRVVQRDKMDPESVKERMQNQWKDENKIQLADFVVKNDGTKSLLMQVLHIHQMLKSM